MLKNWFNTTSYSHRFSYNSTIVFPNLVCYSHLLMICLCTLAHIKFGVIFRCICNMYYTIIYVYINICYRFLPHKLPVFLVGFISQAQLSCTCASTITAYCKPYLVVLVNSSKETSYHHWSGRLSWTEAENNTTDCKGWKVK